jgi:hypothetical protein
VAESHGIRHDADNLVSVAVAIEFGEIDMWRNEMGVMISRISGDLGHQCPARTRRAPMRTSALFAAVVPS